MARTDTRSLAHARRGIRWLIGATMLLVCACSNRSSENTVAVFAASSLTDAFEAVKTDFEAANPNVEVALTFAGSQVLRLQIEQSAPADVFASANEKHILSLVQDGLVQRSEEFARNELVIIVPRQNPAGITSLADLPNAQRLVLGTPEVPVGAYTTELLRRAEAVHGDGFAARVQQKVVSQESNVRLVRAKVEMGEADAAIVYRTDASSSDGVTVIPIEAAAGVYAGYFVGAIQASKHRELAARFIEYLHSAPGQAALVSQGFATTP